MEKTVHSFVIAEDQRIQCALNGQIQHGFTFWLNKYAFAYQLIALIIQLEHSKSKSCLSLLFAIYFEVLNYEKNLCRDYMCIQYTRIAQVKEIISIFNANSIIGKQMQSLYNNIIVQ